jgi:hypothetical protein
MIYTLFILRQNQRIEWKENISISREEAELAFRYRALSGDSYESPVFLLQSLLAVAGDKPMHHPGDPRETAVNDLSKVIPSLVVPRFEKYLVVRIKRLNHSAIVAPI